MRRNTFVDSRRERWRRFETLVGRTGHTNLDRLSTTELFELGELYRTITSDLAIARRDYPGDRVVEYLNGLAARGHPIVYRERVMDARRLLEFARSGFPQSFRAAGVYMALAYAVFVAGAIIAALLVAVKPALADILLPGTAQDLRAVMQQHHLWVKSATENHSVAASFIITNNVRVAFFAFGGGMLVGLGAFYVLAQNGIMLGTVGAMVAQYGLSGDFWSFVAPHGVIELTVIMIAGGAGMMIGDAILRPGLRPRSLALERSAREAARLVLGCAVLLIVAGTIEAFFSPSDVPNPIKVGVAAILFIALYAYLFLSRPPVAGTQQSPTGASENAASLHLEVAVDH